PYQLARYIRSLPVLLLRLRRIALENLLHARLGLLLVARFRLRDVLHRRLAAKHQGLCLRVRQIDRQNQDRSRMLRGERRRVIAPRSPSTPPPRPAPAAAPWTRSHPESVRSGSRVHHLLPLHVI